MAHIRIIGVPPGEAPQQVREAWVGLVLPVARGFLGPRRRWRTAGVLSGPKGILASLRALIGGQYERREGYAVETVAAVEVLARANPAAAQWWREHTPHLMKPGRFFVFPAQVCREDPPS